MADTKQRKNEAKGAKKIKLKRKRAAARAIKGLVLIALGVALFLCITLGVFGEVSTYVRAAFLGIIGSGAYIIPLLFVFFGALLLVRETHKKIKIRFISSVVFVVSFSAFINNFTSYVGFEGNILSAAADFYKTGQTSGSGGVIGGLVSSAFVYYLGLGGANIALAVLFVIALVVVIGITPKDISMFLKRRKQRKRLMQQEDLEEQKRREALQKQKEEKMLSQLNQIQMIEENKKKANLDIPIDEDSFKKQSLNDSLKDIIKTPIFEDKPASVQEKAADKDFEQEQVLQQQKTKTSAYIFPPITLLKKDTSTKSTDVSGELRDNAVKLVDTLKSFGVETRIVAVSRGPAVTRYELSPSAGVKVSKIVNLADDIALNLASSGVRIEAPIPGKAAVGIEVPNKSVNPVYLREVLSSGEFIKSKSNLAFSLGKDISGNVMVGDISKMPHLLIAGATGSGKSVCINTMVISLLYKSTPDEVKLLMVDPKVVELGGYNGIPHLLIPVVTDPKKAAGALRWAVSEMLNRYKLFAEGNTRDLKSYNEFIKQKNDDNVKPLPQIVIIIDELADLMMAAPSEVEDSICRLAQMARAAGMHLVIATQRPSVDVITGVIKANIPSRISFAVSSAVDSRTILDMGGAEKLIGKGDMLYAPTGSNKPVRIQGCFISDKEVESVVNFIKESQRQSVDYDKEIMDNIEKESIAGTKGAKGDVGAADDADEMLLAAIEVVVENEMASVSLLQRRLKLGYARAARIIDQMEDRNIVGPFEGSRPRKVLITKNQLMEMKLSQEG